MTGITEEEMELLRKHKEITEQIALKREYLDGFKDKSSEAYASHFNQREFLLGELHGIEVASKILGSDVGVLLSELRELV